MSTERVPVNAVALLVGRVISALMIMAVISISAHRLSVSDFGLVVSTMAAGFLANTIVTFGTDTVVTRAVAADRSDAVSTSAASLRLQLLGAGVFIGTAGVAAATGISPVVVLIQALALAPMALFTVAASVLRGRQVMSQLLVASTMGSAVALGLTFVGFFVEEAPWVPITAVAIGSLVSAAAAGLAASRVVLIRPAARIAISTVVREAAPFAGMVILSAVGAQAGLLLVELAADEPAGGYGAAVRMVEAALVVPASAMGAFFPAMLRGAHRTDRYRTWMRWLVWYAVVATAGLWLGAGVVNRLVFDSQPDGALLIRVLAIGVGLSVARVRLSFEMIAEGRERAVLMSALAGTVIFLLVGLAVWRTSGAVGISWAQVLGLAVAVVVLVWHRGRQP